MRRRQSHLQQLNQLNRLHQHSAFCQLKIAVSSGRLSAVAATFVVKTMAQQRALLLHQLLLVIAILVVMFGFSVSQASEPSTDKAPAVSLPDQVVEIDAMIKEVWDAYELTPSRNASDSEWCRRVFLDLIGRIPSVAEVEQFLGEKGATKKQALVERLLYDDQYTEELARNWTTIWSNLLIGRTGGNANGSMINRDGMLKYLRDSFARGKPYDQFAHELISATGSTAPGTDNFNGATNFLIDKVNQEKGSQATASTSRIFLGLQVQCTQCHNHPFNDWKQKKYWEMNAFFRQSRAINGGMRSAMETVATLTDVNFKGESGDNLDEAEIYYELRNGLVAAAWPVFVDGTEVEKSGDVNVINRREKFADLTIASPFFAKAIVNRTWAHFLGYGFTSPIDDLGPHNIPTHPSLLEYLGQEFRSSEFNFRQLLQWIVLSKPYALSSRENRTNKSDDPLLGETPKFSHFYLRQMQAEQLYESLLVTTGGAKKNLSWEEQEEVKNRWLQQFNRAFGNDEGGEATNFNGSIPQVLMMFNSDMIREATGVAEGTLVGDVASSSLSQKQMIDAIFMAGLSRKPTRDEVALAKSLVNANNGNLPQGLSDLWWVILNTNEFILVH